ncbi:ANM_HP_G0101070.mRNA.1.CDS.1 [Saccharomyces cerevisiae]|nr:ANM_HP_G0101070.mRNA.1.CDS.1 [Saccharomyces cerevisiae]CAI6409911.1 ANM_HP_G0101070.mRNA.1.CDS.1 [Saccharomyces cerevisiae]
MNIGHTSSKYFSSRSKSLTIGSFVVPFQKFISVGFLEILENLISANDIGQNLLLQKFVKPGIISIIRCFSWEELLHLLCLHHSNHR